MGFRMKHLPMEGLRNIKEFVGHSDMRFGCATSSQLLLLCDKCYWVRLYIYRAEAVMWGFVQ